MKRLLFCLATLLGLAAPATAQTTDADICASWIGTQGASGRYPVTFQLEMFERADPPAWQAFRADFAFEWKSVNVFSAEPALTTADLSMGPYGTETGVWYVGPDSPVLLYPDGGGYWAVSLTIVWGNYNSVGTFVPGYSQQIYYDGGAAGDYRYTLHVP